MAGLRTQFGAKFGPLPVWAWALLAVLAIVGWMYFTKSGFFGAPATGGIPSDTSGGDPYGNNPLGLGGLAGGGNPSTPNATSNPVPAYYDPNAGGYVGSGYSSGDTGSTPTFDLSPYQNVASAALGSASYSPTPQPTSGGGAGGILGVAPGSPAGGILGVGLGQVPGGGGTPAYGGGGSTIIP